MSHYFWSILIEPTPFAISFKTKIKLKLYDRKYSKKSSSNSQNDDNGKKPNGSPVDDKIKNFKTNLAATSKKPDILLIDPVAYMNNQKNLIQNVNLKKTRLGYLCATIAGEKGLLICAEIEGKQGIYICAEHKDKEGVYTCKEVEEIAHMEGSGKPPKAKQLVSERTNNKDTKTDTVDETEAKDNTDSNNKNDSKSHFLKNQNATFDDCKILLTLRTSNISQDWVIKNWLMKQPEYRNEAYENISLGKESLYADLNKIPKTGCKQITDNNLTDTLLNKKQLLLRVKPFTTIDSQNGNKGSNIIDITCDKSGKANAKSVQNINGSPQIPIKQTQCLKTSEVNVRYRDSEARSSSDLCSESANLLKGLERTRRTAETANQLQNIPQQSNLPVNEITWSSISNYLYLSCNLSKCFIVFDEIAKKFQNNFQLLQTYCSLDAINHKGKNKISDNPQINESPSSSKVTLSPTSTSQQEQDRVNENTNSTTSIQLSQLCKFTTNKPIIDFNQFYIKSFNQELFNKFGLVNGKNMKIKTFNMRKEKLKDDEIKKKYLEKQLENIGDLEKVDGIPKSHQIIVASIIKTLKKLYLSGKIVDSNMERKFSKKKRSKSMIPNSRKLVIQNTREVAEKTVSDIKKAECIEKANNKETKNIDIGKSTSLENHYKAINNMTSRKADVTKTKYCTKNDTAAASNISSEYENVNKLKSEESDKGKTTLFAINDNATPTKRKVEKKNCAKNTTLFKTENTANITGLESIDRAKITFFSENDIVTANNNKFKNIDLPKATSFAKDKNANQPINKEKAEYIVKDIGNNIAKEIKSIVCVSKADTSLSKNKTLQITEMPNTKSFSKTDISGGIKKSEVADFSKTTSITKEDKAVNIKKIENTHITKSADIVTTAANINNKNIVDVVKATLITKNKEVEIGNVLKPKNDYAMECNKKSLTKLEQLQNICTLKNISPEKFSFDSDSKNVNICSDPLQTEHPNRNTRKSKKCENSTDKFKTAKQLEVKVKPITKVTSTRYVPDTVMEMPRKLNNKVDQKQLLKKEIDSIVGSDIISIENLFETIRNRSVPKKESKRKRKLPFMQDLGQREGYVATKDNSNAKSVKKTRSRYQSITGTTNKNYVTRNGRQKITKEEIMNKPKYNSKQEESKTVIKELCGFLTRVLDYIRNEQGTNKNHQDQQKTKITVEKISTSNENQFFLLKNQTTKPDKGKGSRCNNNETNRISVDRVAPIKSVEIKNSLKSKNPSKKQNITKNATKTSKANNSADCKSISVEDYTAMSKSPCGSSNKIVNTGLKRYIKTPIIIYKELDSLVQQKEPPSHKENIKKKTENETTKFDLNVKNESFVYVEGKGYISIPGLKFIQNIHPIFKKLSNHTKSKQQKAEDDDENDTKQEPHLKSTKKKNNSEDK